MKEFVNKQNEMGKNLNKYIFEECNSVQKLVLFSIILSFTK